MNVYQIRFDGDLFFLEAESFGAAVERWGIWMKNEYKDAYDSSWEPEEVLVMRNGFIMSKTTTNEWLESEE